MVDIQPVKDAIAIGQDELARNLLRILIEDYPDNAEVWYQASRVAVNEKQQKAFLEKAVELDPLHHRAANELHMLKTVGAIPIEPEAYERPQPAMKAGLPYAGFPQRALATVIDVILLIIVMFTILSFINPDAITGINGLIENPGLMNLVLIVSILTQSLYYGYFLSQNNGQTIGKKLLNIRVIKRDGSPLTIWDAVLRNVIGYQISNIIPGIGFLWVFFSKESRTWHDFMANTIVVDA